MVGNNIVYMLMDSSLESQVMCMIDYETKSLIYNFLKFNFFYRENKFTAIRFNICCVVL